MGQEGREGTEAHTGDGGWVRKGKGCTPVVPIWRNVHYMMRNEHLGSAHGGSQQAAGLAVELSLHLRLWREAVELEADRLRTAPTIAHRHIDGYFLVVAIRQVLLSAEAMNKAIKGDGHLAQPTLGSLPRRPPAGKGDA